MNELGIRMEMHAFINECQKKLSAEEANSSRLVTKVTCEKMDKCTKLYKINTCNKKHIDASVKERPHTPLVPSEEICKRVLCNKHI